MGRRAALIAALLSAEVCVAAPRPMARVQSAPIPAPTSAPLAPIRTDLLGRNAAALAVLFGPPARAAREGDARILQFTDAACILDAYLYPPAAGGDPVVTHVDTRTPLGTDFDRAACVAALRVR